MYRRLRKKILSFKPLAKIIHKFFASSYAKRWDLVAITEADARKAVWSLATSENDLEKAGHMDAERLKPFIHPDDIVLDLGCGIGRVTKHLASFCREIYGVDGSRMMLTIAKKRLTDCDNVYLIKNNGKDLSIFADEKFDFAFCLEFLQHLEREDAYNYLKELFRVLRSGGIVYLQFSNLLSEYHHAHLVENSQDSDIARMRYYSKTEVRKILKSIGFSISNLFCDDRRKGFKDCDILAIVRRPTKKILNVGCGDDVYGTERIDLYPSKTTTRVYDVEKGLPYEDESFDEVYSRCLFEHLRNPGCVLSEMNRVCKKDGKVIIITDNAGYWRFHISYAGPHHGGYYEPTREKDRHYALFTEEHLKNHIKVAGLNLTRWEYGYFGIVHPRPVQLMSRILIHIKILKHIIYPRIRCEAIKPRNEAQGDTSKR